MKPFAKGKAIAALRKLGFKRMSKEKNLWRRAWFDAVISENKITINGKERRTYVVTLIRYRTCLDECDIKKAVGL